MIRTVAMPYKYNESRRHKFEKARYQVENWREYNEALRLRGDITVWISEDVIEQWHPSAAEGRLGRPQLYSEQAIECCLMLRQVYKLPLGSARINFPFQMIFQPPRKFN